MGYSKEYIKGEILNILKTFDSFCRMHGLKYMLCCGTLLGAVRHKGFIPWDDDIDVIMTVDEYRKLRDIAAKDPFLDEERRYRIAVPGDKDYAYSFIKILDTRYEISERYIADRYKMYLYLDVFKADNWPENRIKERIQLKSAHMLLRMNEICVRGNIDRGSRFYYLDKLVKPLDMLFSLLGITSEKLCVKLERIAENNAPSGYMGKINEGTGSRREKMESSVYTETSMYQFENTVFPGPKDYDRYLSGIYGDYMTPPDPGNRISHEFTIIE